MTAAFFQQLINEEYDSKYHRYQSFYGTQIKGISPNDRVSKMLEDFYAKASGSFKKMQIAALKE